MEPAAILVRRLGKKGNAAYLQVLIQWSSMSETMATWEDYKVLFKRFPKAPACGQADVQGGGSLTATPDDTLADEEEHMEEQSKSAPRSLRVRLCVSCTASGSHCQLLL